jgi:hypothetical protein
VSDFALYAFITINNKTEKLKLLKTIKNGYLYSNDKYTLQIDILSKKPNSEGSDITGKITVTTKSSQRIEKAMVGYVGC